MFRPFRPWSRALAIALTSLLALSALVILRPLLASAGEGKRARSNDSWTTKTEWRDVKGNGFSYTSDDDADDDAEVDAYVYTRDNGRYRNGSGSNRDWREAEDVRHDLGDKAMFWFRRDGERYVITDPALLRELGDMFAPQEELGRRQGELGRRQGELGRFQGELGRKQGELGIVQARLSQRQALLSTRIATMSVSGRSNSSIEREQDQVSRQQDEVSQLQSELGEQQSALGEKQSALGEQQSALGREQERAAKEITMALSGFTRRAIASGQARRVD